MKDTELQAERKAFEAWWPDPLYDGHGLYRAPAQYAWAGWKARAAIEADRAQRVPDGLTLAVIGHKHFGNPIPQAWYAAAKELLASTPAPAQQEPSEAEMVCAEAYQVVGCLLSDLGLFETEQARKILDNLSEARRVHQDVLPWKSAQHQEQPQQEAAMQKLVDLSEELGLYEAKATKQERKPMTDGHCMCQACYRGVIHTSDCAVHNAPALPVGACDCGAEEPFDKDLHSVLFEVERAVQNGNCPWEIEAAFEAYEIARRAKLPVHGIKE